MRRIAINGFGRIGRALFRLSLEPDADFEVVAINDLTDTETLAHLLKFDSVWPRFDHSVEAEEDSLIVDGREIAVFSEKDPAAIDWSSRNTRIARSLFHGLANRSNPCCRSTASCVELARA